MTYPREVRLRGRALFLTGDGNGRQSERLFLRPGAAAADGAPGPGGADGTRGTHHPDPRGGSGGSVRRSPLPGQQQHQKSRRPGARCRFVAASVYRYRLQFSGRAGNGSTCRVSPGASISRVWRRAARREDLRVGALGLLDPAPQAGQPQPIHNYEIGRASCRERV